MGTSTFWNPQGLPGPVQVLLYPSFTVHIYCPIVVKIGVRHLHIILLKMCEFREIRRRLDRILLIGVDDMTFTRASSAVRYVEGNECLDVVYCVAKYTICNLTVTRCDLESFRITLVSLSKITRFAAI